MTTTRTHTNTITGAFSAKVRGKNTGLAGCNTDCPMRADCLRAESALSLRVNYKGGNKCHQFIRAGEVSA